MRLLDGLFAAAKVAAALFLATICVLTLVTIAGRSLGYLLPIDAEMSGFSMAAATFLALASTFRAGGHIRVGIFLRILPPRIRLAAELWSLGAAAVLVGYFGYATLVMVWDSFLLNDLSTGIIPVPLWIPQASMLIGIFLLEIALVEALIRSASTGIVQRDAEEQLLSE